MATNRRLSQADVYNLDDFEYRDYLRAELSRARKNNAPRKRGITDALLTLIFFVGIVLIVMHQNGMIALAR